MRKAFSKLLKLDRDESPASAGRTTSPAEGTDSFTATPAPDPAAGQTLGLSPESTPATETAANRAESKTASRSVTEDLWSRAYEILFRREPDLVSDYALVVTAHQPDETGSADEAAVRSKLSNAESVKKVAQELRDTREATQWKFTVKGKSHKTRDQLEKLVKLLTLADGVVKQAASAQPYAALAWSAVSVFLPLVSASFAKDAAMVQGFTTIGDLQLYWKNCEDVYLKSTYSQHYQQLVEPLCNVYSYILEYQVRAICHLSKKQLSRAWEKVSGQDDWATKETDLVKMSEKCKANIEPLKTKEIEEKFQVEMGKLDSIYQVGTDIVETIRDERQRAKEDEFMRMLKIEAGDYQGGMNFNRDPVKGTCEWFYSSKSLSDWLISQDSGVFWVTAGPGCGKSVLARSLVQNGYLQSTTTTVDIGPQTSIQTLETVLCYFFFKDEAAQRTSIKSALCAILHQIFIQDQTNRLLKQTLEARRWNTDPSTYGFDDVWDILAAAAGNYTGGNLVCVLDALDECRAMDRDRFVARLDSFLLDEISPSAKLKFLITSRPYDDIEMSFRPLSQKTQLFRFDADERYQEISHDINLVIDESVAELFSDLSDNDRRRIVDGLKSKGTNTYLWLHLTLETMKRYPSRYGRRRDVESLLAEIPSKLSEAYEKTLSRSESQRQTNTLLQILLAAKRPLTLGEANYALTMAMAEYEINTHQELDAERWNGDFATVVKNLCGLIVSIYDDKISFIHLTAREFLTKEAAGLGTAQTKWEGHFANPVAMHRVLARCCIQYLLLAEFTQSQLPATGYEDEQYGFLDYAARSWHQHFQELDEASQLGHLPQVRHICSTSQRPLKIWSPIYLFSIRLGGRLERMRRHFYKWSDLAVASFLGLQGLVQDLVESASVDVNQVCAGYGTALHAATAADRESVVKYLVSKGAEVDKCPSKEQSTPLDLAVVLRRHLGISRILLENGASPFRQSMQEEYDFVDSDGTPRGFELIPEYRRMAILAWAAILPEKDIFYIAVRLRFDIDTPDAILLAAKDQRIIKAGDECVAVLLSGLDDKRLGDNKVLTADIFPVLLSVPSVGKRALQLLKGEDRQRLILQKKALRLLRNIPDINSLVMDLAVPGAQLCLYITDDVLGAIAQYYEPDVMRRFLQFTPPAQCTIKALMVPAARNWQHCLAMLEVIIAAAESEILDDEYLQREVLEIQFAYLKQTEAVVRAFLQLPEHSLTVKKLLITLALDCWEYSDVRMDEHDRLVSDILFHGRAMKQDIIDEKLLEYAASSSSASIVRMLLEHSPRNLSMAGERYLVATAENYNHGREVMEFLLERYGQDADITLNVVKVAANRSGVFEVLLRKCPNQVPITAAVVSQIQSRELLQVVLRNEGDGFARIAAQVLRGVVNPLDHPSSRVKNLLDLCPLSWFEPTEALILDVLEGRYGYCGGAAALLIHAFGDQIAVTERIVAAAVSTDATGAVADMFRSWRPEQFRATPWIVESVAASGNIAGLDYLVNASDGALAIDDKWYRLARFRSSVVDAYGRAYKGAWAAMALDGAVSEQSMSGTRDAHGKAALHTAARNRVVHWRVVQFLLEETGADVHAVDRRGWTPLHFAAYDRNARTARVLLEAGADPYQASFEGETPVSIVEDAVVTRNLLRQVDRATMLRVLKGQECDIQVDGWDDWYDWDESDKSEDAPDGDFDG